VRVGVDFVVTYSEGFDTRVGQVWSIGGASQIDTPSVYAIDGSGGKGTMIARDAPSPHTPDVPARLGYRIDGDTLFLSVSSGMFAGEHTLKRK
jgi:hypothetical protein